MILPVALARVKILDQARFPWTRPPGWAWVASPAAFVVLDRACREGRDEEAKVNPYMAFSPLPRLYVDVGMEPWEVRYGVEDMIRAYLDSNGRLYGVHGPFVEELR